ncbi:MAG: hypothetical protein WCS52_02095 [bacterium]
MNTERHIVEWIISAPCLAFWLFCVVINPILFVRRDILDRPNIPSVIPIVGGIVGGIGLMNIPIAHINHWYWIAGLLDFGSAPWLVYVLGKAGIERIRMMK